MRSDQHTVTERRWSTTAGLIDEEQLIRTALWQLLSAAGLEFVAEPANAKGGGRPGADLSPHVVLIDIMLPRISGL
jgi:DNA-binding NarL/FixJ family response regulator